MALPTISLTINNTIYGSPENGDLIYKYAPFFNLKIEGESTLETDLSILRLSGSNAGININRPLILDTEISYDESVNLLVIHIR